MMIKTVHFFLLSFVIFICCKTQNYQHTHHLISAQEFEQVYDENSDILLDVRTAKEYRESHINGAVNMDVLDEDTFMQQIESLPKDKTIYLYCRSGNRSIKATEILENQGFDKVHDIEGGYIQWQATTNPKSTP